MSSRPLAVLAGVGSTAALTWMALTHSPSVKRRVPLVIHLLTCGMAADGAKPFPSQMLTKLDLHVHWHSFLLLACQPAMHAGPDQFCNFLTITGSHEMSGLQGLGVVGSPLSGTALSPIFVEPPPLELACSTPIRTYCQLLSDTLRVTSFCAWNMYPIRHNTCHLSFTSIVVRADIQEQLLDSGLIRHLSSKALNSFHCPARNDSL